MKRQKYLALLRGINVGGNNIIKMAALKAEVEKCGFSDVSTFIQSGNVLFTSDEKNVTKITRVLERHLSAKFLYNARMVVISQIRLKKIVSEVPEEWKHSNDLRCYISFIREPVSVRNVMSEITLKEGVDSVKAGVGVLYMSTRLSGLTKSGFTKLIGTKIYKDMTIRNYTTVRKILTRMEGNT